VFRAGSEIAIIMLTVRDDESDKVQALDAGADDYVTKPFMTPELLARIRAALRRAPASQGPAAGLVLGTTEIDFDSRQVTAGGRRVRLTPKEFDLRYLVAHAAQDRIAPPDAAGRLGPRPTAMRSTTCAWSSIASKKIEARPSQPVYL
jgi:two-component system KDP operon response regulator KdpE